MSRLQLDIATLERDLAAILENFSELKEDEGLRVDVLEGETSFNEVLARLVGLAQDNACMADAIKARMAAMDGRKKAAERREEAFRALIFRLMQKADVRKLTLPEATLSISATPASVKITDETLIPKRYTRTSVAPDKPAIKTAIQNGVDVPGACMSNGGERLSVRVA